MVCSVDRPIGARRRRIASLAHVIRGLLILFTLFTAAIGVREARADAKPTVSVPSCLAVCSILRTPAVVPPGCKACLNSLSAAVQRLYSRQVR